MTHVSFTATRKGLTVQQLRTATKLLPDLTPTAVHHGCCRGGDTQLHYLVTKLFPLIEIHRHWPRDNRQTTACTSETNPLIDYAPKTFLDRDLDIAEAGSILVACPAEVTEVLRSGTWTTVRRAWRLQKPVILLWPGGDLEVQEPPYIF